MPDAVRAAADGPAVLAAGPAAIGAAVRRIVLVTGAPAAGKSTLAAPLAAELGFTLLAKDRIKETLHDALAGQATGGGDPDGPDGMGGMGVLAAAAGQAGTDLGWSRRLGAAAMELLWALAADAPAVVLEANFWPDDERHLRRLAALACRAVEVRCVCPAEVAARRYARRRGTRHPAHAEAARNLSVADFTRWDRPVGAGDLIEVDTTAPVDIGELAFEVRSRLGPPQDAGAGVLAPATLPWDLRRRCANSGPESEDRGASHGG